MLSCLEPEATAGSGSECPDRLVSDSTLLSDSARAMLPAPRRADRASDAAEGTASGPLPAREGVEPCLVIGSWVAEARGSLMGLMSAKGSCCEARAKGPGARGGGMIPGGGRVGDESSRLLTGCGVAGTCCVAARLLRDEHCRSDSGSAAGWLSPGSGCASVRKLSVELCELAGGRSASTRASASWVAAARPAAMGSR